VGEHERDTGPLVPLSSAVYKSIPGPVRKELGIVDDYRDPRTGSVGYGAPAKLVYALGVLPGPVSFFNRVTTASDRAGQTPGGKTVAYFGLRAIPFDPVSTKIENLYNERTKVTKQLRALNQRGVYATNPTPAYTRLLAREKDMTSHIMALRTQRGDVIRNGSSSTPGTWEKPAGAGTWEKPSRSGGWQRP
jgi:hypothetical protein